MSDKEPSDKGPSPPIYPVRRVPSAPPLHDCCDGCNHKEENEDKNTKNRSDIYPEVAWAGENKNRTIENKNKETRIMLKGIHAECPLCNMHAEVTDASACPYCREHIFGPCFGDLHRKADTSERVICPFCRHAYRGTDRLPWQSECSHCREKVNLDSLTKLSCGHVICKGCQKKKLAVSFTSCKNDKVNQVSCTPCEDYLSITRMQREAITLQQKKKSKRNKMSLSCGLLR